MLLSKKNMSLIVGVLALFLSACGFQPLHGSQTKHIANNVEVANIHNREGQELRNLLIDRLYTNGRPANPAYRLKVTPIKERITKLGVQKDATATRAQMKLSTTIHLIDLSTNKVVLTRELRSISSFNLLQSQFTILSSEADARQRGLKEISDQALTQLALYFDRPQETHIKKAPITSLHEPAS